jgi:hypothetical protein
MHINVEGGRMHRETVVRSIVAICAVTAVLIAIACEGSDPASAKSTTTTSGGTSTASSTTAVTTSVQGAPAAPSNLGCQDICATYDHMGGQLIGADVYLRWNDNSNNETAFVIERNGSMIDTLPPNMTSYKDHVIPNPGGNFFCTYRVRARNAAGYSAYSDTYTFSHVVTTTALLPTSTTSMLTTSSAFSTTTTTIYTTSSMFTTSSIFF